MNAVDANILIYVRDPRDSRKQQIKVGYCITMKLPARIELRPDVMMGKPCVRGTRIPVYLLLQKMAAGETQEMLVSAYPQLTPEDLLDCLQYAASLASEEVVLAEA